MPDFIDRLGADLARAVSAEALPSHPVSTASTEPRLIRGSRQDSDTGRRSSRRRRRRLLLPSGLALASTAALAVVLLLLPSSGTPVLKGGLPVLGTGQAQARAVLARAAQIAATTPPSSVPNAHQFLYTEWIVGTTGNEVINGHNIGLTNGDTEQDWEAPDGSGRQRTSAGFFHLLTPAYNVAWNAAENPNLSGVGGIMDGTYPTGAYFNNCGISPTGPAGLSTDPKQLLSQLVERYEHGRYNADGTLNVSVCILETSAYPPLRAAVYRMIGELPGIESLGTMTDALGRSGDAIGVPVPGAGEKSVVIFDPATGRPLESEDIQTKNLVQNPYPPTTAANRKADATFQAEQALPNGTVVDYRVFVESGVVNSSEALPGGGSIPFVGGITRTTQIVCANLGSSATGVSCTAPSAGTVATTGVTCVTGTIPIPGVAGPTRVICPSVTTSVTGTTGTATVTTGTATGAPTAVATDTTTGSVTDTTSTTETTGTSTADAARRAPGSTSTS